MTTVDRTGGARTAGESADRAYWAGVLEHAPRPEEPAVATTGQAVLRLPESGEFARLARSGGGTAGVVLAGLAVYGQRLGGAGDLMIAYRAESVLVPVRVRVSPYTHFAALVREIGIGLRRARRHRFRAEADDPWPGRADRRWALSAEYAGGQWRITVPGPGGEFVRVFEQLVAEPARAVGGVGVSTTVPGESVSVAGQDDGDPGEPATLLDTFRETVRRTPAAIAVRTTTGDTLTYAELDARANRWARRLVRAGAGPDCVIALAVPRSVAAIVAVYAVLKAGAAFLQLDPGLPTHRRARMLATARPIALPGLARPGEEPVQVLERGHLDLLDRISSGEQTTDPQVAVRGDNLAYVLFTSGSSGHPKGVGVPHRALGNQLTWMQDRFGLDANDTVLQKTPVTFDVSLWELLWPLQYGAQLVVPPPDGGHLGPAELAESIRRFAVTTVHFVPTLLRVFRETEQLPATVRRILVAGEAFPRELAEWCATGPAEIVNLYGPTEACIAVTGHRVVAGAPGTVPIGTPIHRVGCRVLDATLRQVPDGVAGELYLTGVQLARGYLHRPAETAAGFVADPYDRDGNRMYRTGDIVRRGTDGLEYLGRNDFQVKIHGLRIEPAEIETALLADDAVSAAVVVAVSGRLHGYLVAAQGRRIDRGVVQAGLAQRLPESLRPHTLTVLDSLPVTSAGKIDRKALPKPDVPDSAYRAPADPVAATLAGVYGEVLGRERIGADDSFFALGGDSIMSILLVARAKTHGIAITAQQVFEHRTPAALAAAAGTSVAPVLAELPGGGVGEMPLPPAASYLVQRGGGWRRFVQALVLDLPAGITATQLTATLSAVMEKHDMLRSRLYRDAGGRWRLFADPIAADRVEELVHRVPLSPGLDTRARDQLTIAAYESALSSLDPATGAVVGFVWLDPAGDGAEPAGRLIVVAHHIAVDGVSWRILIPDLITAWVQVAAGRAPALPAVATSMRRWTHALAAESQRPGRIAELEYWRAVAAADDPPLAGRPFDPARDLAAATRYLTVELDERRTNAVISTVAERYHAGANEILLTALVLAVARWRPRNAVLVRLEGHGRDPDIAPGADISRTVGWFTALYPVRFGLDGIDIAEASAGGESLGHAIKAVKEQMRSVPGHGIGYGLLRYLNPETAPALPQAEPGQIVFNYLGSVAATAVPEDLSGLGWIPTADPVPLPRSPDPDMPAAGALELDVIVVAGRLHATIGYSETLFDAAAGAEFAAQYETMLGLLADHAETARGGYTPSDFPLVGVGQSDIERWENRYPGAIDIWPLGPMQAGLFYHAVHSGRALDPYVLQLVITLTGAVDTRRLRAAARAVLAAHPSLRTAFHAAGTGIPVAVVPAAVSLPWSEIEVEPDSDIGALLAADRSARFDLARPPLIRFTLVRFGAERAKLVVTSHHIVFDGWSVPLLMQDLLIHYAAPGHEPGPPRPTYRDYLRWLTRWDRSAAETAWRTALAEAVPTFVAGPDASAPSGVPPLEQTIVLSEAVSRRIADTAAGLGVTVNTVVQAAWALVLSEHTGGADIVFGATVSGRPPELPGVEAMVGLFINTVAVRVRLRPDEPVAALLTRLQAEQAVLTPHHHLGLAEIQACATGARQELFDTLLVFESYPFDPGLATAATLDGLSVTGFESHEATHFPLALSVWSGTGPVPRAGADNRLRIVAGHRPDEFAPGVVDALLARFGDALAALGAEPAAAVGEWAAAPGARTADHMVPQENRRNPQ
ncbi:non-ribosomal peptide synthetase [Nocardia carnea]|uniref:non-ribosomal peptide synthetase n=1 Tax=Nocardia carnea TaxID=37328 RepID=UPI002458A6B3|nr:non-ribosomal peptide synthetase [Nocardia carnea]